jgi:hypothetical protein
MRAQPSEPPLLACGHVSPDEGIKFMLESSCHVLAHMTLPTVFKLWPSRPHLSFLQHLDYHTLLQYTIFIL